VRSADREGRFLVTPHRILRFEQPSPAALSHKLFEDITLDCALGEEPDTVAAFLRGSEQRLELERDTPNRAPRAIKVIGLWRDAAGEQRRGCIGWVPAIVTEDIMLSHAAAPLGATLRTVSRARLGHEPEVRFDLWYAPLPLRQSGTSVKQAQ
jgi:hypothetical protein